MLLVLLFVGASINSFHMRSDDFGYFQAISDSLIQGRLVLSDWAVPKNLPGTVLGIGVFQLTGSFYLATYGLATLAFAARQLPSEPAS